MRQQAPEQSSLLSSLPVGRRAGVAALAALLTCAGARENKETIQAANETMPLSLLPIIPDGVTCNDLKRTNEDPVKAELGCLWIEINRIREAIDDLQMYTMIIPSLEGMKDLDRGRYKTLMGELRTAHAEVCREAKPELPLCPEIRRAVQKVLRQYGGNSKPFDYVFDPFRIETYRLEPFDPAIVQVHIFEQNPPSVSPVPYFVAMYIWPLVFDEPSPMYIMGRCRDDRTQMKK